MAASPTFKVHATVGGVPCEIVVDTGTDFSVVPDTLLRAAHATQRGTERVFFADGSVKTWPKYVEEFVVGNESGPAPVLGGDDPNVFLLGAATLFYLGLCVDQRRRRLVHTHCVRICPTVIGEAMSRKLNLYVIA